MLTLGSASLPPSHLSLDDQFDSEGDEVGEELLQPVRSEQQQQTHIKGIRHGAYVPHMFLEFDNLLSVSLQMQTELVEVQIAV